MKTDRKTIDGILWDAQEVQRHFDETAVLAMAMGLKVPLTLENLLRCQERIIAFIEGILEDSGAEG